MAGKLVELKPVIIIAVGVLTTVSMEESPRALTLPEDSLYQNPLSLSVMCLCHFKSMLNIHLIFLLVFQLVYILF
jgi:hypothetical protein